MTDAVRRPSTRDAMLAAAEDELRTSGILSLDSAARAAGVTKPGLMYHFSTKEELMTAVLDRVLTRYQQQLSATLGVETDFATAPAADRMRAYVAWSCAGECEPGDLVMFADPRLRESLTQHWAERLEPWLRLPDDLPAAHRSALLAARLLADGVWFNLASELMSLDTAELDGVRAAAFAILEAVGA
jgi:AcrR family transcriptional regulator